MVRFEQDDHLNEHTEAFDCAGVAGTKGKEREQGRRLRKKKGLTEDEYFEELIKENTRLQVLISTVGRF